MSENKAPVWDVIFPSYIRNLLEIVAQEGINIEPILTSHHLNADQPRLPGGFDAERTYFDVVEDILRKYPVEGLGLKTGKRFNLSDHGLLGYALNSCANLKKALDVFCDFSPIFQGYEARIVMNEPSGEAFVEYNCILPDLSESVLRFHVEETFTAFHGLALKWEKPIDWYNRVDFSFSPPPYTDIYSEYLPCEIHFNQPHNRFYFDQGLLLKPYVGYDEQLFNLTVSQCKGLLADMPQMGKFTEEVRAILARCTGRFPNLEEISEQFNMSSATLRRRLAAEGTNYQSVLKVFRMQLACRYLIETELSVNEIAYLTGYTDPANFNRAFRSMHGQSPNRYRADQYAKS